MSTGNRRYGKPRTNTERRTRHTKIYGAKSPLPRRRTGLKKKK